MKKIALLFVGGAALFAACDKDEELFDATTSGEEAVVEGYHHELTASVADENPASRAGFDLTDGTFHWLAGDEISVANESYQFAKYTLKTGAGTASATFQTDAQTGTPQGYALHPHSATHNFDGTTLTFNLPAEYTYTQSAGEYGAAPMVAAFEADAENLLFKHVGGAFCFQVAGLPAGTTWFKFSANAQITGNFAVTEVDGNQVISLNGGAASSVTINIPAVQTPSDAIFYIPVPTGTYNGFTISVGNAGETTWSYTSAATNTVNRKSLKKMPKVNLSASTPEAVADVFANGGICKLAADVTLDGEATGFTLAKGKTLILDLNGHTISQEKECTGSYQLIANNGNLTITGDGKISFKDLSAGGETVWGSYTITNSGTLLVENGTIEHLGSLNGETNHPTDIPIHNYAGKVVINDGIISSPHFRSLRDFTAGGEIIINGGTFKGQIWMQGLGKGSSSLTINGGNFSPTYGYDGSSVYITNGTNDINLSVTGGYFNTKIGCQTPTKEGVTGTVTGGIFTESAKSYTDPALIAAGYDFVANGDGTYTVKQQ